MFASHEIRCVPSPWFSLYFVCFLCLKMLVNKLHSSLETLCTVQGTDLNRAFGDPL